MDGVVEALARVSAEPVIVNRRRPPMRPADECRSASWQITRIEVDAVVMQNEARFIAIRPKAPEAVPGRHVGLG